MVSGDGDDTRDAADVFGGRWRWLGRPAFLASVAVLAVNDHVLKSRLPGWWTGKLSDVAGVAVVATLLAVPLGVRRGLAGAGLGFTLLKGVPGVAEAAAPVLGGVTARDRGDLLALAVLAPLAVWLQRPGRRDDAGPSDGGRISGSTMASAARRVSAGASSFVPLVGALAAVMTATATSCARDPAVTHVVAMGDGLYALVDRGHREDLWARSTDGGQTWDRSRAPRGFGGEPDPEVDGKSASRGPLGACGDDGVCYRLRGQRVIERRAGSGGWTEEFRLSEEEFDEISSICIGGDIGILESVAVAQGADAVGPSSGQERPAVATLGAAGVLVRSEDGTWARTRVLSVPPVPATGVERGLAWGGLAFGPVLVVALWLIGRRRWPSWRAALGVVAVGWTAAVMGAGALGFALEPDIDPSRPTAWFVLACATVTTAVAVAVARRPPRWRPPLTPAPFGMPYPGPAFPPPPPAAPPGIDRRTPGPSEGDPV